MAIFRKKVKESAYAIFAIQADTPKEADKIFDDFFYGDMRDDGSQYDSYREHMNETMTDSVEDLSTFSNEEDYNRSGLIHDFFLKAPKKKQEEPLYDLFITFKETGAVHTEFCLTMGMLIDFLKDFNANYILKPAINECSIRCNGDVRPIFYTAELRKETSSNG